MSEFVQFFSVNRVSVDIILLPGIGGKPFACQAEALAFEVCG